MPLIEELQSAGFPEDEIGSYMSQKRTALREAGFPDDEINSYFGEQPFDLEESVTGEPPEKKEKPPSTIFEPAAKTAKGMLYGEGLPEGLGYLQKPAEAVVDYLGQFFMSPEEEQEMMAKHPNLMATRYATASLLLPGVSEKFASPTELSEFVKKFPEEQRVEITGLAAGYTAFGAATKGASVLASHAVKKYPWLAESIGKLLKDTAWYRKATIKERGLAVQSVDDMVNAGLGEAQILKSLKKSGSTKEFKQFKEQAIKKRVVKRPPEKPAEPPVAELKKVEPTPEQFLQARLRKAEKPVPPVAEGIETFMPDKTKLPEDTNWPAIKLEDDTILYDKSLTTHAKVIDKSGIKLRDVKEGGWITTEGYKELVTKRARAKELTPESIAKNLDLIYNGPQKSVEGKTAGYLFTDPKTKNTFIVETPDKAAIKAGLVRTRKRYEPEPAQTVAAKRKLLEKEKIAKVKTRYEAKIAKIKTAKEILQRRRSKIRAVRDYFKLTDAELRQISRKDIRLMSNYEFKQHIDRIRLKAEKLDVKRQAKNELVAHIREKEVNVENLRKAMKLPTMKNMTVEQIRKLDTTLEPFQKGDEFLSVRKLEVVDRTELKGIKTWREARERLSKKLDVPVKELQNIRVSEFDRFRYETGLAEKNPFYKMMVEETAKKMLASESEYLSIEKDVFALAKKIKGKGFFIPQQKNIRRFMESPPDKKAEIKLTKDELALVDYMTEHFSNARDYLIQIEAMNTGRQNYFTHVRRGILEAVKEDGIIKAVKEQFEAYKLDEQTFNILDRDTGEILAMDKFFKFAMHRAGKLKPTENVVKAFLTYMRIFKRKQALDEMVPLIDIYAHALTPRGLTRKGLLLHGNLIRFVREWINTQKGRHITLVAKQNGKIDAALRTIKMFTSLRDLGFNIPVSVATEIGEQITTYQLLGKVRFTLGKVRQNTKRGKAIIEKYRNLIGKNPWKELVEPSKAIGNRLMEGIFVLFRDASARANKTFLLGSLSKAEFKAGTISPERLAALRTELGRYRMVQGMKSVIGATPEGRAYTQYKRWAIPILRTTIKNLGNIGKKIAFQKPSSKEFKRSALELYRLVEVTAFIMLTFGMVRDADDNSFAGKMINKAYREATTLIQALQPRMFLAAGRTAAFIEELGVNLTLLLLGEKYKTTDEYKGVRKLKRQITPVAISQFRGEKKKKKSRQQRMLEQTKGR